MQQFDNISTLIFDFGGVLIRLDLNECIRRMKALGVDEVDQYLSNYGQSGFFLRYEKGEISTQEFREEIRNLTNKSISDNQIDDAWCSFLVGIPVEKIELLQKLKAKYRILLLSNTNPLHIEKSAATEFGKYSKTINDYFDKCYLSYEMKMVKPNCDIFESLLCAEGLQPENCLFLDDGPKNIEMARSLGIQSYLVDENESLDFLLDSFNIIDQI
jgi:putative hydrolase of the HAD superfamily